RLAGGDSSLSALLDTRDAAESAWRKRVARPVLTGHPPTLGAERHLAKRVVHSGEALAVGVENARADSRDDSLEETRNVVVLVVAGLIGALLAALVLFSGLVRSMRAPLRRLVEGAHRLAGGDLTTRVEARGPAEIATLGGAFNEMATALERDSRERDRIERMKDDFLLTVSHELRTPVTSVKGFAEMLATQEKSLNAGQREAIEAIATGASDLSGLIDDLVDLARSDAGRLRIEPRATSVKPLLDRVARQMRPIFAERGQRLTVSVPPGLPRAKIDPDRIVQVLTNLLANANKYGNEGGKVKMVAEREGGMIAFEVSDDGPGLSKEERDHVFERFWRADSGVTQRVGGSGLGLAIARSLVELHNGSISAHRNDRGGATFRFTVPATHLKASRSKASSKRPSRKTAGARG
ncbi:MAG: sensor histidine kinase, partial [Solirubrobacterales bacterium]